MKKHFILVVLFFSAFLTGFALPSSLKLIIAPGTVSDSSATLFLDKPNNYANIARYRIILNGRDAAEASICNYRIVGLSPKTVFKLSIDTQTRNLFKSKFLVFLMRFTFVPLTPV